MSIMKLSLFSPFFLFFSLWLFIPSSEGARPKPALHLEDSQKAVWSIRTSRGNGTAFFISPHLLVTNHHVMFNSLKEEKLEDLKIAHSHIEESYQIKKIWALSPSQDLAILEVENESSMYLNTLSKEDLVEDEKWYVQGYPFSTFRQKEKTGPAYQDGLSPAFPTSSARNARGYSGSPVLNQKGEVLGVTVRANSNLIFYTPISYLNQLKEGSIGISCQDLETSECMDQAWKLLQEKSDEGDPLSQMQMSYYMEHSNPLERLKLLRSLADQGYPEGQHLLAAFLAQTRVVDFRTVFDLIEAAAFQNFPPSQYQLGMLYLSNYQNVNFLLWMKKSSENDYSLSHLMLGAYYKDNHLKEKGLKLIEKAAEQELYPAQIQMAKHYMNNEDMKRGIEWLEAAFTLESINDPLFYRNLTKIPHLMEIAAKEESPKIQYYFGIMNILGIGMAQNQEEGWEWVRRSSENGFEQATNKLKEREL